MARAKWCGGSKAVPDGPPVPHCGQRNHKKRADPLAVEGSRGAGSCSHAARIVGCPGGALINSRPLGSVNVAVPSDRRTIFQRSRWTM